MARGRGRGRGSIVHLYNFNFIVNSSFSYFYFSFFHFMWGTNSLNIHLFICQSKKNLFCIKKLPLPPPLQCYLLVDKINKYALMLFFKYKFLKPINLQWIQGKEGGTFAYVCTCILYTYQLAEEVWCPMLIFYNLFFYFTNLSIETASEPHPPPFSDPHVR